MMDKKQVNLSPNDVLEAKFKRSFQGYNPSDVDEFLDMVTEDYVTLNKEIDRLKNEWKN